MSKQNMQTVLSLLEYMAHGPCHCESTHPESLGCIYCDARKLLPQAMADERRLQAAEKCVEALRDAADRMYRAREILHKPVIAEWRMLSTDTLQAALQAYDSERNKS